MRADGVAPDAYCYCALMDVCADAGRFEETASLWDEMIQEGVRPDAVVAAAALDACVRGRQPQRGLAVVQQARTIYIYRCTIYSIYICTVGSTRNPMCVSFFVY